MKTWVTAHQKGGLDKASSWLPPGFDGAASPKAKALADNINNKMAPLNANMPKQKINPNPNLPLAIQHLN